MSAVVLKKCAGLGKTLLLIRKYRSKSLWRLPPVTAFKSSVFGFRCHISHFWHTIHDQPHATAEYNSCAQIGSDDGDSKDPGNIDPPFPGDYKCVATTFSKIKKFGPSLRPSADRWEF